MKYTAYQTAVWLLASRDYSHNQIKAKLLDKGYEEPEIDTTLERCVTSGYIDDARYATALIRSHINKGHGVMRIRQSLHQKGLQADIITLRIEESECDWFELAKCKAQKKFADKSIVDYKDKAKRIRFLMGQGFDYEQSCYALT
ncbi:regulatory protein RecX [Parashewanella spongiae]|uniref:Regulatory protein RecX n=2 Tax=Parashewanella spongiae TaxID=342950 RepID=A0A3A6TPZ2_9GAMM|nr:regulatory protein RecX [Parashewanella spongiae]MCL1077789.1 recombination regulator RecX [Parashewanella spongiae]RJY18033.1 regulatory protein RecX [Parashewanella spongiae]